MFEKEKACYESRKSNAEPSSKHDEENNNHETAAQYDPDIVELVENVSTIVWSNCWYKERICLI